MSNSQKICFGIALTMLFIPLGNMCICAEQESAAMLDKQVSELEEIWKTGKTIEYFAKAREITRKVNPRLVGYSQKQNAELTELLNAGKTNEYHAKAKEFSDEMRSHWPTNYNNKVAAKLFGNLISKEVKIKELKVEALYDLWMGDLPVMFDLYCYLIAYENKVSIEERRINALLFSRYLGRIRKELIPNFKPLPTVMNVSPPKGTPCAASGMDPEAITNPVLKAQYLAAIRENSENGVINKRQQELRNTDEKINTRIIDYIIKTFRGDDASTALLAECIKAANLTDKEKEEVLKKVGVKKSEQGKISGAAVQGQQNIK